MQRKQSKKISQSKNVLEPWFRMKIIKGTFVPTISPHVTKLATLIKTNNHYSQAVQTDIDCESSDRNMLELTFLTQNLTLCGS